MQEVYLKEKSKIYVDTTVYNGRITHQTMKVHRQDCCISDYLYTAPNGTLVPLKSTPFINKDRNNITGKGSEAIIVESFLPRVTSYVARLDILGQEQQSVEKTSMRA